MSDPSRRRPSYYTPTGQPSQPALASAQWPDQASHYLPDNASPPSPYGAPSYSATPLSSPGGGAGGNPYMPYPPSSHYTTPRGAPGVDYYTTPRSMSSVPPVPMGQYGDYPSVSQPIPVPRPSSHSFGHHPSLSTSSYTSTASYGSGSPQSPTSPVSQLAQYAYGQSPDLYPASPPRPYQCEMCPLSFSRQHDLKRHRETHSGEKNFFCNGGCGKSFTRKDALKRHQYVKRCGADNSPEDEN